MTAWPILSVVTFLPLVGALLIYAAAATTRRRNAMRAGSRCGPR
jgi:NADH:ubiquinone oxidoreductase subunit 4 (subunit M)